MSASEDLIRATTIALSASLIFNSLPFARLDDVQVLVDALDRAAYPHRLILRRRGRREGDECKCCNAENEPAHAILPCLAIHHQHRGGPVHSQARDGPSCRRGGSA